MRTRLTSVLAAALAAGALLASPATARPVHGTQMRANAARGPSNQRSPMRR